MGADNSMHSFIEVKLKAIDWVNWLSNHMTVNLTVDNIWPTLILCWIYIKDYT